MSSLEYSNPDEPSADQVLTPGNHLDIFNFFKKPCILSRFHHIITGQKRNT